ncbi:CPCC family cysteine-rich protein [Streptomyces atratus]|uniref:CPCC family cysteine-rich protein n=1 Tax=Streptomyces atratus TaxID=1893 RepID=UPI0033ED118E
MVTPFVNIHGKAEDGPYRCPCCGFVTLGERGNYEICSVCFWEDDGQDDHDADRIRDGPNGRLSLNTVQLVDSDGDTGAVFGLGPVCVVGAFRGPFQDLAFDDSRV